MAKFIAWLKDEAKWKDVFGVILAFVFLNLFWDYLAVVIMIGTIGLDVPPVVDGTTLILSWNFLATLILAVFVEEVIFRVAPLTLATLLCKSPQTVLLVAGASSVIFGLVHGSWHHIFIQGVAGILFSCVFLKCGGFSKKYVKATAASVATHFLVNGILIGFMLLAGKEYL